MEERFNKINSRELIRQRQAELQQEMNATFKDMKVAATDVIFPVDRAMLRSDQTAVKYVSYGMIAYRTMRRVKRIVSLFRTRKK